MTTTASHYLTMCKDEEGRVGVTCFGRKVVEVERECGLEIGDILLKIDGKTMEEDSGMVLNTFREAGPMFEITLSRQVPSVINASFRESEASKAFRLRERQIRHQQLSKSSIGSSFGSAWMTPRASDKELPWATQSNSPLPLSPNPLGEIRRDVSPVRARSPFESVRSTR